MGKFKDLTGQRFGRLVVIHLEDDYVSPSGYHKKRWLCHCDCGNDVIVWSGNLINSHTQSCGCQHLEKIATEHFKFIDELKYEDIKREYNEANISKFGDLLALLQTASPRLKSINKAQFLSDWLVYYYIPSMLAIDNIEYLIFVIISLLNGDSIISMSASDIVKETKGIKSIKTELLKLVH